MHDITFVHLSDTHIGPKGRLQYGTDTAANLRQVATFVSEKLSTLQGVISTSTHFILKPYKEHGVLMEREHAEERLPVSP